MEFYSKFLSNDDAEYRKNLIEKLTSENKCDCYRKVLKKSYLMYLEKANEFVRILCS